MTLPVGITPVSVSAASFEGPDGAGWDGTVIFQPTDFNGCSVLLFDAETVIGGTATGTMTGGAMPAVDLVPTDCQAVSPSPFAYRVTVTLEGQPDMVFANISLPSALGPETDLRSLLA